MSQRVSIKSAERIYEFVTFVSENPGSTVSEIATSLDFPTSTVHDHISTLEELGYLACRQNRYYLGTEFLRLGEKSRQQFPVYEPGRPQVQRLADETSELANLFVEEQREAVIICTAEGDGAAEIDIDPVCPGTRIELHSSAPGKAILAHLDRDSTERYVERVDMEPKTQETITDEASLLEELETIREQGYATDFSEHVVGMRGLASPIVDRVGTLQGVLSLYGPAHRMDGDRFERELPNKLLRASNIVEININYN